jgi:peptide/nickel transport system permease protein
VHPLLIVFLIFGIPAGLALLYIFVRGSSGLRRYILTRIVLTLPMVIILATVVFFVMRIVPGNPVDSQLGPRGSPELREAMKEQLGLNEPLIVQYGQFLGSIFTLDLGDSLIGAQRPVIDELGERLPATLELIVPATALALLIGLAAGTIAAVRRKRGADYSLRLYSVVIYSMPIFWLGLLFRLVFSVQLGWTPVAGRIDAVTGITLERTTNLYIVDSIMTGNWAALGSTLHHLILPVLTLGLVLSGVFVRLTRINVIETLQEDYIGAARARGIREWVINYRHALKNAMIPVITLIGLQVAILLAGAVLTESVFSWPGMGRYLVDRISSRDFTAVQSTIAMFALFVALISLAVDIIYSLLDPRVRY